MGGSRVWGILGLGGGGGWGGVGGVEGLGFSGAPVSGGLGARVPG